MFSRAELKNNAKFQLKGYWTLAILTCLCYTVISQGIGIEIGAESVIFNKEILIAINIIAWIIYGPIEVGFRRFLIKLSRMENEAKFSDLFSGFNVFFKSLLITVIIGICVFIGTILLIIPGIIAGLMFSQAYYILAENPDLSAIDCLTKSSEMMKGFKWKLFVLGLSFIGWIIACVFTLGIGFLWYIPYYEMTMTEFYLKLKEYNM